MIQVIYLMILKKRLLSQAVVLDLDRTLLHPDEEAIPVKGRSGYSYLSGKSAELLAEISRMIPLAIATGRNAKSVRNLTDQLDEVSFCGFVLENGLVVRTRLNSHSHVGKKDEWAEVASLLSCWERLEGYEKCLGFVFPSSSDDPESVIREVLARTGKKVHIYRERHKIFVYPHYPGKLFGIRELGFEPLIAIGDETNDLDMLRACTYPATLSCAHESVRQCVEERKGYCSRLRSHAATEDLLLWANDVVRGHWV